MPRRVRIIANPVSGRGKGLRLARKVADRLRARGVDPELVETKAAGDAKRLAGEAESAHAVAGVGGDGTVNEVLNGVRDGAAVGMIPSGTANVLAKELGLPRDADGLARVLAEGREVTWDVGVDAVGGRKFLLFASAGYDAHVVHVFHAARSGPIRMWQYVLWGLKSILDYRIPRMRVEIDGAALPGEAAWVVVSNVASYGGPLVFTPRAKPADGAFEVLVQRGNRLRDVVRMFWRALVGSLMGIDLALGGVSFHSAKRVKLTSIDGAAVPVQMDGDPAGTLPSDFGLQPRAAKILGP